MYLVDKRKKDFEKLKKEFEISVDKNNLKWYNKIKG